MLIEFKCYKNYFYFLIYWISEISISITKNLIYVIKIKDNQFINDSLNEYLQLVILVISDLLAGFLVLYTKCSFRKKDNNKREKSKGEIEFIYVKNPPDSNKKLKYLILITFLDFFARSPFLFFYLINKNRALQRNQIDIIVAIDIFMRYFFSKIILKTKIYKHHLCAIIISIIGFFILCVIDFSSIIINDNIWEKVLYLIFLLLPAIFYPLEDTINKIILSDDFLLPHSLMFDRGLIEFVILIIFSIILFLTVRI